MITQDSMQHDADASIGIYTKLEQDIYAKLIDTLKHTRYSKVDKNNALAWQLEQLSKMGVLTESVVSMAAKFTKTSKKSLEHLIKENGIQIVDEVDDDLKHKLHKKVAVSPDIRNTINSMMNQTWKDLDNSVNESLLTRNTQNNAALRAYQGIIKQTTLETVTGLKTHERAFADTVYKWIGAGLSSPLTDKGGHHWSLEGYSRMVIQTTAHQTFNNLRLKRMQDYGTHLAVMTSHPASRPACAYIQGQVVNVVPPGNQYYNDKYDSIYNHGYGKPAGTQGINCGHELIPFIDGVNTNNQPQYDPDEAIAKGKVVQKQRSRERAIRATKKQLAAAQELGDEQGVQHYKSQLANQQKSVRELVKNHDFLARDYSREKVVLGPQKQYNKAKLRLDQRHTLAQIKSGAWGTKVNADKQAPHMKSTHGKGKSYFDDSVDAQKLVDKYTGKGKLIEQKNGFSNRELVTGVKLPGKVITLDGTGLPITGFTIHHSKQRTHVVPYAKKE